MNKFQQTLHMLLLNGEINIVFRKADGQCREMSCKYMLKDSEDAFTRVEGTLFKVWDTKEQGYRSFRTESLVLVNGLGMEAWAMALGVTVEELHK